MRRFRTCLAPVAAALLATACCVVPEERSLHAYSLPGLAATHESGGQSIRLDLRGDARPQEIGTAAFEETWAVVDRGITTDAGVAFTLSGGSPDDAKKTAGLVLVLPTPLQEATTYEVEGAFPPPSGLVMDWRVWGPRAPLTPGRASLAFRLADYVGLNEFENDFVAAAATGTVRVESVGAGGMDLVLDVWTEGVAGNRLHVQGPVRLTTERYTPPCT